MHQARNQTNTKSKVTVYDEASSSSSDQATVYSHQEHARPRSKVEHALSPSTSDTSTLVSKQSLSSSIDRFRCDFDELKCKMKIFGESLNLCHCIANDFRVKLNNMEKRLELLERRQGVSTSQSNYPAIIQKNKRLSHKTQEDAKRLQLCKTEKERCEVAARICRNYLSGAWKTVEPNSLLFRRINGGLSNIIYYIALPDNIAQQGTTRDSSQSTEPERLSTTQARARLSTSFSLGEEPRDVLLRIYGQVHGERAMDAIVTESVIFTLLSERKLGPKLHGVFSGGRIEEYIPARCLLTKELGEPALLLKIAEKMAAIHSMNVPLSKEPTWLWKNLSKWIKTVKEESLSGTYQPKTNEEKCIIEDLKKIDFEKELEWLKKYLSRIASPVVFCHNDMQEGNILIVEDTPVLIHPVPIGEQGVSSSMHESSIYAQTFNGDSKELSSDECDICDSLLSHTSGSDEPHLFLIDFEYCAYNYRGFDIANYFQEWTFDYTNQAYPFYYVLDEYTATFAQKDVFIRQYLKHYAANISEESDPPLPTQDAVNQLRTEVEAFAAASHLFWSLWSYVNATKSKIPFGYWEYGASRYDYFKKLKDVIVKEEIQSSLGGAAT